jgi:RNA-directed DNA polymerase
VSAELASPTDRKRVVVSREKVRAPRHTLYRAAKADPGRRFHTLMDKLLRGDVLWRGWVAVRRNDGAPGIDKLTLDAVEEYGIDRFLTEIQSELREGRYRPLPSSAGADPETGSPGADTSAGHRVSSGSGRASRVEDRVRTDL